MSSKSSRRADFVKQWHDLTSALARNADDLPHLESRFNKLQNIIAETVAVVQEQAAARASKQEASRRLEDLLSQGQKVATFLRVGVREHYGNRSEKLAEFHIQPLRGRRPSRRTEPEPVEPAESEIAQ